MHYVLKYASPIVTKPFTHEQANEIELVGKVLVRINREVAYMTMAILKFEGDIKQR